MYSPSDYALNLLKNNYRQVAEIIYRKGTVVKTLTEADIIQGGLSINRYCISGEKIEIGSAIASELTLKLDNRDNRFADISFEGAELEVKIGVKKWDAYRWENAQVEWIPCGFFTVDETPRKLNFINLSALDRMVKFDKEVSPDDLTFPMTVSELLTTCCSRCGILLQTDTAELPNRNYVINNFPEEDSLTYRRLIQWLAEITGTCAYIDWNGKLRLEWYTETTTVLSPAERYSSDMYENDITISGVQITDTDEQTYLVGTDDYAFNIEGNALIQHDYLVVATAINNVVNGFTYRPYTCTCKPAPHIYPLDTFQYIDKDGEEHTAIITSVTFKMNTSTSLEGKGETNEKNNYSSNNPTTKEESIVLKKIENRVNDKIGKAEQQSLDMNDLISNSLGLHRTVIGTGDSKKYYFHDKSTLASSTIIYSFQASGFAWTDDWNDGNPTWHYGFTKDGNAIFKIISTYHITAEEIDATNLHVSSANIDGTITASQIDATNLHVSAANIDGTITANSLVIKDTEQHILLSAGGNAVKIANFDVSENAIKNGKTSYNDEENDGVYIGTDGIGLGKGTFYVTPDGKLFAVDATIAGHIYATSGSIGGWQIGVNDGYIRSNFGQYGSWSYSRTGTDLIIVTGYRFTALTPESGFTYVVKNGADYDNSQTLVVNQNVRPWVGPVTPGGDDSGGQVF